MNYQTVLELILNSDDFTVGGGSAAALAGAEGAALVAMVAKLSLGKEYGLSDEEYHDIINELESLKRALLEGSVEDTQAYLLIKNAYALPKQTEEQKEARRTAIRSAGFEAASVPLNNAKRCYRALQLANNLAGKYNPNTSSDYEVAVSLMRVGVAGCKKNVEVNLPLIKDEQKINGLKDQVAELVL